MTTRLLPLLILACSLIGSTRSQAACWETTAASGALSFTASQAGAPSRGTFADYSGEVCLPEAGEAGAARVVIQTTSIDMGLPEFNTEMRGPLFFDTQRWPEAVFATRSIAPLGENRYRAAGDLTIRDVTRSLETTFKAAPVAGGLRVTAELVIARLDFDLGRGEWADTAWVGDEVEIQIDALLIGVEASKP